MPDLVPGPYWTDDVRHPYFILWHPLDKIPAWAISDPLTDAWDVLECSECQTRCYRLYLGEHLAKHNERPWWRRWLS